MPPLFCAVSLARFNAVGERTSSFREQDRHLAEIEAALWRAKLSETCVFASAEAIASIQSGNCGGFVK